MLKLFNEISTFKLDKVGIKPYGAGQSIQIYEFVLLHNF